MSDNKSGGGGSVGGGSLSSSSPLLISGQQDKIVGQGQYPASDWCLPGSAIYRGPVPEQE